MNRIRTAALVLACFLAPTGAIAPAWARPEPADLQRQLAADPAASLDSAQKAVRAFYAARDFQPLWTAESAESLRLVLKQTAMDHGLPAAAYGVGSKGADAAQEAALTSAALRLARDLAMGRIPPYRMIGGLGEDTRPHFDQTAFLKALAQPGANVADLLTRQAPTTQEYQNLMAGLKAMRAMAANGGWPNVPDGPSVKPDESDPRIPTLRRRLVASGDLIDTDESDDGDTTLDEELSAALKLFQIRHGLEVDGALGKRTVQTLNVPLSTRIHQVELGLERLRQMPRFRDGTRIDVNIAAQSLVLFEGKMPSLEMRVVAGDVKHQTPTMATREAAITLNPTWTVPASIARKEILPKLKRDPNYLAHNNLHILDPQPAPPAPAPAAAPAPGGDAAATTPPLPSPPAPAPDAASIDWNKLGNSFPFVLRQVPGPDNALGRIKFNLQNQDSIYLHDTNQHAFFKRSYRLLSHGCVRLEHPMDLALALLGDEWHDKLQPLIDDGKTRTLSLHRSLPVYLMYQTAWAGADGILYFRDDAYGNDQRLDQALAQSAMFTPRDSVPGDL